MNIKKFDIGYISSAGNKKTGPEIEIETVLKLRELLKLRLEDSLRDLVYAEKIANQSKDFVIEGNINFCIKSVEAIIEKLSMTATLKE